jgi:hypothetical protein
MKRPEEFKKAIAYVAMTEQEARVIEELARCESRNKSNMIRALILEALRARAFAQTDSA